jgi:protoporphyrinogen oxidase
VGSKSIVYIPYYLRTNSPRYRFSDDRLLQEFVDGLRWCNPRFTPEWIEECKIFREPHAQAICAVGFASLVPDHRTPVTGLYLTDSSQNYPEDRTISAAIRLGRRVAKLMQDDTSDFATEVRFPRR